MGHGWKVHLYKSGYHTRVNMFHLCQNYYIIVEYLLICVEEGHGLGSAAGGGVASGDSARVCTGVSTELIVSLSLS